MLSGKDDFFYKDDLDAVLAIIDAYMFENDKDMESDIVTFAQIYLLEKIVLSNAKRLSIQSRYIKARESKTLTVH